MQAAATDARTFRAEELLALSRSIPWLPLAAAALLSTLLVAWRRGHEAAVPLQAVAILLASAMGFALDDAAAGILASSPTSLLRRRVLRLLLAGPPTLVLWAALLAWQGTRGTEETIALTLLFAGLTGLALGVAGVATLWDRGAYGGIAVPPALFLLLAVSAAVPARWRPLPLGDVPGGWTPLYVRWGAAAAVGAVVFLVSSRDPAARRFRPPSER